MKEFQFVAIDQKVFMQEILKGVKSQLDDFKGQLPTNTGSEYMSKKEVADYLSVSIGTIDNRVKDRTLIPLRLGGNSEKLIFRRLDVDNALIQC